MRNNILKSIPVLSIFVLLGIVAFSTFALPISESDGEAYAAESTGTSSALIIDNGVIADNIEATYGEPIYISHTIQVKAENVTGYTLTITGPVNLTNDDTIISGAGGVTPVDMLDNTWGYGWDTTSTANDAMTYRSFDGSAQNLSGTSVGSSNSVSFTRKLVFAAKFGQDADAGHYQASVNLNLAVTPKELLTYKITYDKNGGIGNVPETQIYNTYDTDASGVMLYVSDGVGMAENDYYFAGWATSSTATTPAYTPGTAIKLTADNPSITLYAVWKASTAFSSSLSTMQGMTATICRNAGIGATKTLTDTRNSTTYTIRKHEDGKCWMTQDLNITNTTITSSDSNVTSAFTIPTSSLEGFSTHDVAYMYKMSSGGYYSWYAATAGTGTSSMSSGEASASICPKGWRLPSSSDYETLIDSISASVFRNEIYQFRLTGAVYFGKRNYTLNGWYWTRTANDDETRTLALGTSYTKMTSDYRPHGLAIRCVAYSS